ncbi:hypothetical protein [Celeribacter naphthalenivorans]|uniref:hypothetical protein n=1 Tax=Celeribacter naphthalenivorans TaxID=1614694 RepID=UPI001CFC0FC4|nr:hypothetical protein [Celeribacter naphthalenivorans]
MINIPVGQEAFTSLLKSSGLIEISMNETKGPNLRRRIEFQLSSPIDEQTKAVLYSPSKPTVRTFQSLAALSAILKKVGVTHMKVPLEPGVIVYRVFPIQKSDQAGSRKCA